MRGVAPFLLGALFVALPALADQAPESAPSNPPNIDYMLQCQGCHLASGGGSPKDGVPDLRDSVARFLRVAGGREYLIRVPGASGSPLTDAELAAVLNWVVQTFGPAEAARGAPPFSAQEVTRHRRPPLAEVYGIRQRLIGAMEGTAPSR